MGNGVNGDERYMALCNFKQSRKESPFGPLGRVLYIQSLVEPAMAWSAIRFGHWLRIVEGIMLACLLTSVASNTGVTVEWCTGVTVDWCSGVHNPDLHNADLQLLVPRGRTRIGF